MRDHIRREAGQSLEAAGWLVPIAFAVAALAAVAMTQAEAPERPAPDQPVTVIAAPPDEMPTLPAPADGVQQVAEHVQAF